jgi:hypothetical protein
MGDEGVMSVREQLPSKGGFVVEMTEDRPPAPRSSQQCERCNITLLLLQQVVMQESEILMLLGRGWLKSGG